MMPQFRILFVCHGNICRSPMAEFYMKKMLSGHPLGHRIDVESAATSAEELGNPVYPPARRILQKDGIFCDGKFARRITPSDYDDFDLLIGMDHANMRNMERAFGGDPEHKLHLLLEYAGRRGEEVDDPWYSGDFELAKSDIISGCRGLLARLQKEMQ